MKKALMIVLVALLVLSACSTSRQKLSPQGNLNFKSANVYYTQKDNDASLMKALGLYNKVLADNPQHVIALKRTADLNFFFATKIEPKMVEKDGVKEYPNLDKAPEVIAYYKITYAKYDSVLNIINTFTKLTEEEKAMKRDAAKKKESSWVRIFKIGQLLFENKNFELAIPTFETLYQFNPAKQEPLRMLVAIYQEQKNNEQIKYYANKVLAATPDDIEMIKLIGTLYYLDQDYENAILKFKEIQVKDPIDTNNLLLLADSYDKLKQTQSALDAINKVLKIEPENLDALVSAKVLAGTLNNKDAEIGYMKRIIVLDASTTNLAAYCYLMYQNNLLDGLMEYAEMWYNKDMTSKEASDMCMLIASKIGRKDLQKKYLDISSKLQ